MRKTAVIMLSAMMAASCASARYVRITGDPDTMKRPLRSFDILKGSAPTLRFYTEQSGGEDLDIANHTARFYAALTATNTAFISATSTVTDTTSGYFKIPISASDTLTNGVHWYTILEYDENSSSVYAGTGAVTFINTTATGAISTNDLSIALNLDAYTISGTLPLANIAQGGATNTQALIWNASGSTWVPGNTGVGDLTAVQVSGGVLSITNGTGPIPTIILSTSTVNSAESDPLAVLADGTRAMSGGLEMGTNTISQIQCLILVPDGTNIASVAGTIGIDSNRNSLVFVPTVFTNSRLNVGQEIWTQAKKAGAITVGDGTNVYYVGASGDRPTVGIMDGTDIDKLYLDAGTITAPPSGNDILVTSFGFLSDQDTSGFTAGQKLGWDSLGNWTTNPTIPHIAAVVTRVGGANGEIYRFPVKILWNLDLVTGNGATTTNAVTLGGLTMTGDITGQGATFSTNVTSTIDHTTTAPSDDEFPTAGWVRSLSIGGGPWYFTTTTTNGYGEKTTNFVALAGTTPGTLFTNAISSPVPSDTYLAGGVTTNTYSALRGPITFEVYANRVGGNTSTRIPVHAEIYYVYDGTTNHLGGWEVGNQVITATTPTRYTFIVAFDEPTITGAVHVIGYIKSGTVSGSAAGLNIYGGGIYASHMTIPSAATGSGDLTAVQVSGGLLTVANGTGPIPTVGLTTAAVNSAESDPLALLADGSRAMSGDLNHGGNNATNLNGVYLNDSWPVEWPGNGSLYASTGEIGLFDDNGKQIVQGSTDARKAYNTNGTEVIDWANVVTLSTNLNAGGGLITNVTALQMVDDGELRFANGSAGFLADSTDSTMKFPAPIVAQAGLDMTNQVISQVGDPNSGDDAMDRDYADSRYVNDTGDTMSGTLAMGTNDLTYVRQMKCIIGGSNQVVLSAMEFHDDNGGLLYMRNLDHSTPYGIDAGSATFHGAVDADDNEIVNIDYMTINSNAALNASVQASATQLEQVGALFYFRSVIGGVTNNAVLRLD